MTNGDKIRQMSDEEILEFFFGQEAYTISMAIPVETVNGSMVMTQMTTKRFIDWMKEEAVS